MKNLATKNTTDFTVTESGDAYISQRKCAELCGVERNSIVHFFKEKSDISQGVNSKDLQSVVQHYAQQGKEQAVKTLCVFAEAGAKAYIYHEAGYVMEAKKPMSQLEMLAVGFQKMAEIEKQQEENSKQLAALQERLDFKEAHLSVGLFLERRGYKLDAKGLAPIGKLMTSVCSL